MMIGEVESILSKETKDVRHTAEQNQAINGQSIIDWTDKYRIPVFDHSKERKSVQDSSLPMDRIEISRPSAASLYRNSRVV